MRHCCAAIATLHVALFVVTVNYSCAVRVLLHKNFHFKCLNWTLFTGASVRFVFLVIYFQVWRGKQKNSWIRFGAISKIGLKCCVVSKRPLRPRRRFDNKLGIVTMGTTIKFVFLFGLLLFLARYIPLCVVKNNNLLSFPFFCHREQMINGYYHATISATATVHASISSLLPAEVIELSN